MLAIIQARMSSERLPGKMLMKLTDKTVLEWVHNRVSTSGQVSQVIVATSSHVSDDILEDFCKKKNIEVFRGSLNNVSRRFLDCAKQNNAKEFIRVNGDSPFIDKSLIERAINFFLDRPYDLVTNVQYRSYPKGQSVEVLNTETFSNMINRMKSKHDLEHVTNYFYENPLNLKILNFQHSNNHSNINLSIDTIEDFKKMEKIAKKLGNEFSWIEASQELDSKNNG